MIDTVIFDYGGVVADHYSEPYQSLLAEQLGTNQKGARDLISERSPQGRLYRLDKLTKSEFWDAVRQIAPRKCFDDEIVQDLWAKTYIPNAAILSLMNHLKVNRKLQIGMVMNEDRWRYQYIIQLLDWSKYIDGIVASFEVGYLKPDIEMYKEVLVKFHRSDEPNQVLYIDDRKTHVEAAEKVGMRGYVHINPGESNTYIANLDLVNSTE